MEDLSRNEALLDALVNGTTPPETEPKSRMEAYLLALLEKGVGGGSGGNLPVATDEDVMRFLDDMNITAPVTSSDGSIYTNNNGEVYVL